MITLSFDDVTKLQVVGYFKTAEDAAEVRDANNTPRSTEYQVVAIGDAPGDKFAVINPVWHRRPRSRGSRRP